jgi:hypothetical protein
MLFAIHFDNSCPIFNRDKCASPNGIGALKRLYAVTPVRSGKEHPMRTKSIMLATSAAVAMLALLGVQGSAQAYEYRWWQHEKRVEHRGNDHNRFLWFFHRHSDHDRR